MISIPTTPRKNLNKAFLKVKPTRSEIEHFKKNLVGLLDGLDETESEEHNKNDLGNFLKNTFYQPGYYINTKDRADLVIHTGPDSKSAPGVLIEVKKPGNKSEMIKKDDLKAKAFYELILYYLRERITIGNLEVKYLIATNVYEWYIFDAALFEKTFAQNKSLIRQFNDFEQGRLAGTTTDFFYNSIAEPFVSSIETDFSFTRFDFRDYNKVLRNDDKTDDSKLIALFKVLSPEHLLKLPFLNDSNTLDKTFYSELLHIIGLTETKSGSKKIIERKKEGQRDPGSLLENTILQLDTRDKISRLPKPTLFGETYSERLFTVSLELVITWLNRILFLKLLEAQLIRYHKGDPEYGFMNTERIDGYDDLDNLFFRVLARKAEERDPEMAKLFSKIPYLNSSLFEPTELEQLTIFISNLQDHALLPIISSTVLKDNTSKKRTGKLSGLQYLFEFLDAYDFAGEGSEEIQEDNKTLINASVLGLIFEKINGYKDGSFFTPGFITMYMCRETIRRAVVQKFNDARGWNCESIDHLYDRIEDRQEANRIVNSLKICDPAVGSGHFLVSALNEIIAIKSDLKILTDREGRRLKEYRVDVANDELIVTDEEGDFLEYLPGNNESQRIQEALFHEKQTIIENCLFGVDINSNSVKICRLRLWIELLKNAYYKPGNNYTELETLPNIDINIKCGNSLISRYSLDADIKQALKKSKWSIDSYRLAVMTYRTATTKEEKRTMERLIESIKSDFETEVAANDKLLLQMKKLNGDLFNLTQQTSLFERTKKEVADWNKQVNLLTGKIKKLETELEEIKSNKIYENAFEWRFEFPEVLNNEGEFVGFDVVIGNPPYGVKLSESEKQYFITKYIKTPGEIEIYCYFIELALSSILKKNGHFSFITTNTIYYLDKFAFIRENVLLTNEIISLLELEKQVFADAPDIVPAIYVVKKGSRPDYNIILYKSNKTKKVYDLNHFSDFQISRISQNKFENKNSYVFSLNTNDSKEALISKLSKLDKVLSNYKVVYGIKTGDNKRFVKQEISENGNWKKCASSADNIKKYIIAWKGDYLNVTNELAGLNNINYEQPKILIQYIRKLSMPTRLVCAFDKTGIYYPLNNFSFIVSEKGYSLSFLLGLLNSKLMNWYFSNCFVDYNIKPKYIEQLPLPNNLASERIDQLVNNIFNLKENSTAANTSNFEKDIDQLVYELYGLTEEEIRIVEGDKN